MQKMLFISWLVSLFSHVHAQDNQLGIGFRGMLPANETSKNVYDFGLSFAMDYLFNLNDAVYVGPSGKLSWLFETKELNDYIVFPVGGQVVVPVTDRFMIDGEGGYTLGNNLYNHVAFLNPGLGYQFDSGYYIKASYTSFLTDDQPAGHFSFGGSYYFIP